MHRGVRLVPRALALLSLAAALPACVVGVGDYRGAQEVERVEKRFAVSGPADVRLVTFDGSIEVRGWDRPEVVVEVERRAIDRAMIESIEIVAEQSGDRIAVEAKRPPGGRLSLGFSPSARIRASVPRRTDLVARSGDGPIGVDRMEGSVDLETGDGSVRGTELIGRLKARTSDGLMKFADVEGRADLDSGDGSLALAGRFTVVRMRTNDGSVSLRAADGSAMDDDWDVRTGDGSVTVELPDPFDAMLDATSGGGSVRIEDLQLDVSGEIVRRHARGRLGQGGKLLRIRTDDGTVTIRPF